MIVYTPIKKVISLWLVSAAVGFYPVTLTDRIKLTNILDMAVFCAILFSLILLVRDVRPSFQSRRLSFSFFVFMICWLPGFAFSNNIDAAMERYFLWGILAISVQILFLLPKPKRDLFCDGRIWYLAGLIISILLIFSYFYIGVTEYGRVTMPALEGAALVYRYKEDIGLLPDPNVLSYGLGFLFFVSLAYSGFRPIVFCLIIIALLLVGSRSALLSFLMAFCYWLFVAVKIRTRYLLIAALFFPLSFLGQGGFQANIFERFRNPENYIERSVAWINLLDAHLSSGISIIVGHGFTSARRDFGDPHNFYLSALYDGGVLALIGLAFVYFSAFRYTAVSLDSRMRGVANTMLVFNLVIGIFYWQDQMFFSPFFLIWILSTYERKYKSQSAMYVGHKIRHRACRLE